MADSGEGRSGVFLVRLSLSGRHQLVGNAVQRTHKGQPRADRVKGPPASLSHQTGGLSASSFGRRVRRVRVSHIPAAGPQRGTTHPGHAVTGPAAPYLLKETEMPESMTDVALVNNIMIGFFVLVAVVCAVLLVRDIRRERRWRDQWGEGDRYR